MSKSKGNMIDPIGLLNDYGSDVVRYWTGTSRLGQDTVLSPNTLQQGKRLITKLWNAVRLAHIALLQSNIRPVSPRADQVAGVISHPLDQWLLGRLSELVSEVTQAFETYEYAQALRLTEDFFWRTYCDNYLEMVKARTRFEGLPNNEQRSALHTLHHASSILLRLFAPFTPYVTETLNELLHGTDGADSLSIHARGQWPKAAEQVETTLSRDVGDSFVEILAAGRKVKSELATSIRTPVATMTLSPAQAPLTVRDIERALSGVAEDLRAILNVANLTWADQAPSGQPSAHSPDGRICVALEMAQPETQ